MLVERSWQPTATEQHADPQPSNRGKDSWAVGQKVETELTAPWCPVSECAVLCCS